MSKRFPIHNAHKDSLSSIKNLMFECWQRSLPKLNPAFILPWQYPVPLRQIGHACPQQAGNNQRVTGVGCEHNRKSEKHAPLLSPPLKLIQADVTNTAPLLGSFSKPLCVCDCITRLPWASYKDCNYKITHHRSRFVQKMKRMWLHTHTPCFSKYDAVIQNIYAGIRVFLIIIMVFLHVAVKMWSPSLPPQLLTQAIIIMGVCACMCICVRRTAVVLVCTQSIAKHCRCG